MYVAIFFHFLGSGYADIEVLLAAILKLSSSVVNACVLSQPVTDAEKHSASTAGHQAWSGDEVKRADSGSDNGVRMESASSWTRRNPSDASEESDKGSSGRKITTMSHTGSWRRGMTAQVGVTSPRTKSTSSTGSTGSVGIKTHSSGSKHMIIAELVLMHYRHH